MPQQGDDWTDSEEQTLQNHWDTHTAQEIADILPGRTVDAVYSKHYHIKENGRSSGAKSKAVTEKDEMVSDVTNGRREQRYDVGDYVITDQKISASTLEGEGAQVTSIDNPEGDSPDSYIEFPTGAEKSWMHPIFVRIQAPMPLSGQKNHHQLRSI